MRRALLLIIAKIMGFQIEGTGKLRIDGPIYHYCVGREFGTRLGPRLLSDGNHSGEALRQVILGLLDRYSRIRIDFTRCRGGASAAFFDEAFGKLKDHGYRPYEIFDRIEIETTEPTDILLISEYVHQELHHQKSIVREIGTMVFESSWRPC